MSRDASAPFPYTFTLQTSTEPEVRQRIQAILRAHNEQLWPYRGTGAQPLSIQVHDAQGAWVGGILAATYWGWLVIDVFALQEPVRGQGVGTALMTQVEKEARTRGCTRAHTSTYAHQALGFYQRLGYEVVGQMDDYPEGYTYYWLLKGL